jgi:hypothetical protein
MPVHPAQTGGDSFEPPYRSLAQGRRFRPRFGSREAMRFLMEAGQTLASSLDYERTLQALAEIAVPRVACYCVVDDRAGAPSAPHRSVLAGAAVGPARARAGARDRARARGGARGTDVGGEHRRRGFENPFHPSPCGKALAAENVGFSRGRNWVWGV